MRYKTLPLSFFLIGYDPPVSQLLNTTFVIIYIVVNIFKASAEDLGVSIADSRSMSKKGEEKTGI